MLLAKHEVIDFGGMNCWGNFFSKSKLILSEPDAG